MLYHIARCLDVGVEYFLLDAPDFDVVPKAAPCLAALDSAIEGVERLQEELKGARTTFRKSRRQIEQGSGARRYRDFLTD